MNRKAIFFLRSVIVSVLICLFVATSTYGAEYEALDGVDDIKVVFDFSANDAKMAALYLDLIHQTFKDKNLQIKSKRPDVVVVFHGGTVKLVSSNTERFSDEEKVVLGQIANRVSAMAKDGIKLEICVFAVNLLGVDPATILPEITQVDNGWISIIGYQAKGYSLVTAF